jgi:hypothetical protein
MRNQLSVLGDIRIVLLLADSWISVCRGFRVLLRGEYRWESSAAVTRVTTRLRRETIEGE